MHKKVLTSLNSLMILWLLMMGCTFGEVSGPRETKKVSLSTPVRSNAAIATLIQITNTPDDIPTPNLDDPTAIITQYYQYVDQGQYQEAYDLFTSDQKDFKSLEEYQKGHLMAFKTVKVLTIQPFNEWVKSIGYKDIKHNMPPGEGLFSVHFYAEGPGGMVGSMPNGEQDVVIHLKREDSQWKIFHIDVVAEYLMVYPKD